MTILFVIAEIYFQFIQSELHTQAIEIIAERYINYMFENVNE